MARPKVSVMMITYNHEAFIAQSIESVLMQKTEFPYELVIGEDCSTDNTRAICLEYQRKYPDKIRLLMPETNLGVCSNGLNTFAACNGEYIAFIEGDDYWTTPDKLQKQVDFLDAHLDFALCYARDAIVDELSDNQVRPSTRVHKDISTIEDVCKECYIMSASLVFRNIPDIAAVFKTGLNSFHWVLLVFVAQYGKIKFIDEVMSVYRCHAGGTYSSKTYLDQLIMSVEAAQAWKKLIGNRCDVEYKSIMPYYYQEIINAILTDASHDRFPEYLIKFANIIRNDTETIPLLKNHLTDHYRNIELSKSLEECREQLSSVYLTKAWKIGSAITFPIKKIKVFVQSIRIKT